MSDLLNRIAAAQRDAGERVVMEDLTAKGFTFFTPRETSSLCAHCGKALPLHGETLMCPS